MQRVARSELRAASSELPVHLKPVLDRLYAEFNDADSATDPIQIVRRFERRDDREIVGFIAASLAFGRVASVLQSIERVLAVMGPRPAAYVRRFDPARDAGAFAPIVHRWTRGRDIAALIWLLHQMIERSGSIEQFFVEGLDPSADDLSEAIDSFSRRALALDLTAIYGRSAGRSTERRSANRQRPAASNQTPATRHQRRATSNEQRATSNQQPATSGRLGVCYFFPRASAGSGCKRLNLFLRWMVRHDSLDVGAWTRVPASMLVVPLDTHVIRLGRCLQLTARTSPGWRMAADITASLRELDAADPVKYDFALCHIGMMSACGFNRAQGDSQCPLRGACQPRPRKPPRSRQPSARR